MRVEKVSQPMYRDDEGDIWETEKEAIEANLRVLDRLMSIVSGSSCSTALVDWIYDNPDKILYIRDAKRRLAEISIDETVIPEGDVPTTLDWL